MSNRSLIVLILIILIRIPAGAMQRNTLEEIHYKGMVLSFVGFEEDNSTYWFLRAAEHFRESIKRIEKNPQIIDTDDRAKVIETLERKEQLNRWRADTYSNFIRNYYPFIHFTHGMGEFRDTYRSSENSAVLMATEELKEITPGTFTFHGQVPVLLAGYEGTPQSSLSYAMSKVQKNPPFGPYIADELHDFIGFEPTIEDLKIDPSILMPLLDAEGFDRLVVFAYRLEPGIPEIAHCTAECYLYRKSEPNKLVTLIISEGFGQKTYDLETRARINMVEAIVGMVFLIVFVFMVTVRIMDKGTLRENKKSLIVLFVIFIAGIASGPGYEYILSLFFENLNSPVGFSTFYLYLLNTGYSLVIMLILGVIITQFMGYYVLSRYMTPFIMGSFWAGMGAWMIFRMRLYGEIYPGAFILNHFWLILPALFIPGVLIGIAVQRFLNRNTTGPGKATAALLYFLAGNTMLAYTLERVCSIHFENFYMVPAASFVMAILFEPVGLLLGRIRERDQGNETVQESKLPVTIPDLGKSLERPFYIDLTEPGIQEGVDLLKKCLDTENMVEGGVLYVHGPSGSGKTRYVDELINDDAFSGAKVIRLTCEEKNKKPFQPFINGLRELPDMHSLEESYRMNRIIRDSSGKMHEPVSNIPIVGQIISFLLKTDTTSLTERDDETAIIQRLAKRIDHLSCELIKKAERNNAASPNMIFVVDNYQHIDDASNRLLHEIQKYLHKSKAINPVAFIVINTSENQGFLPSGLAMDDIKKLRINGMTKNRAMSLFYNSLNFSPSTTSVLERIFFRTGYDVIQTMPSYLLESVRSIMENGMLLEPQKEDQRGFRFDNESIQEHIPIPPDIKNEYLSAFNEMSIDEQVILEFAAVIGNTFDSKIIDACMDKFSLLDILQVLNHIEEKSLYISEDTEEENLFRFKTPLARDVILERLNYQAKNYIRAKQILEHYYYLLYEKYYRRLENPGKNDIIRRAVFAYLAEKELVEMGKKREEIRKDVIEHNFEAAEVCYEEKDFKKTARHLAFILRLYTDENDNVDNHCYSEIFISRFIPKLAWVMQNYRNLALVDFPRINNYIADLKKESDNLSLTPEQFNQFAELAFIMNSKDIDEKINWPPEFTMKSANRAYNNTENSIIKAQACFWIASAENILKNVDSSISWLEKAEKHLTHDSDRELLSRILNKKGEILSKIDPITAEKTFHESLKLKKEIHDRQGIAMVKGFLSELYRDSNPQKSIDYAEECLKLNKEMESDIGISIALKLKGDSTIALGNYKEAIKVFLESLNYINRDDKRFERTIEIAKLELTYNGTISEDTALILNNYKRRFNEFKTIISKSKDGDEYAISTSDIENVEMWYKNQSRQAKTRV